VSISKEDMPILENQATNDADIEMFRWFSANHADRFVEEVKEAIRQGKDTEFYRPRLAAICEGQMKRRNWTGKRPNVGVVVNNLFDYVLTKAKPSLEK
jgi:hypothetical protein